MLKKKWVTAISAAAMGVGLLTAGVGAVPAGASTNVGYGGDGNAHLIVGGGSDTTWTTMIALSDLWNEDNTSTIGPAGSNGATCETKTSAVAEGAVYPPSPVEGNQYNTAQDAGDPTPSYTFPTAGSIGPLGTNCDHDTVAQANPAGSSTGIAALNGNSGGTAGTFPYEGTNQTLTPDGSTHNGYGIVDFARSSRQPKLSGGNCAGGNELSCDTFWGFATDGIQVFSWPFGTQANHVADLATLTGGLTADDLFHIWNCDYTQWNQIPGLSAITDNGPIVPWQMNTASGTEATFQSWITNNATTGLVPSGWNIDGQACSRKLASGVAPFENDTKPILNDAQNNAFGTAPAGIVDNVTSTQDPANWIWWGSNGLMSAYPNLSAPTLSFGSFSIGAASIYTPGASGGQELPSNCTPEPTCTGTSGVLPSTGSFGTDRYPLSRDLYIVTPTASADCPSNTGSITEGGNTYAAGQICDMTGTPAAGAAPDIEVNGGTGGAAGAVREFIRFVCRVNATQQDNDPFTGTNYNSEITAALTHNGFTRPALQSSTNALSEGFQSAYKQGGLGKSSASQCSVLNSLYIGAGAAGPRP